MSVVPTPLMEQYFAIKRAHPNHIVFFRMGDFYEMFGEDAKIGSRILGIALTTRDKGREQPIPLAGVPWHAADAYIARLIRAGQSVAVCEQMEDAQGARGLVRREVVRVITPGTALSPEILDSRSNHFLAALAPGEPMGLAYLDLSTGEFCLREGTEEVILGDLRTLDPRELLVPDGARRHKGVGALRDLLPDTPVTELDDARFSREAGYGVLTRQFRTQNLEAFGCETLGPGISAAGALLGFVEDTQGSLPEHIDRVRVVSDQDYLAMDDNAQRLLELVPSRPASGDSTSLFQVLDHTGTAMGSRLLRQWIQKPLVDPAAIGGRQDRVEYFLHHHQVRGNARKALREISDIERLVGRLACERATARDLVNLKDSLAAASAFRRALEPEVGSALGDLLERLGGAPDLVALLERALVPDPPATLREGGMIREGYHGELDELRKTAAGGRQWIADLQARERERTGISTLKVGHNRVFGYYLEVTKPHLSRVPPEYTRRQTLVGGERFVTPELEERESKILAAEGKVCDIEYGLFVDLRRRTAEFRQDIQETARALAEMDVFQALATAALENRWVRPEVHEGTDLTIREGRHPIVEHFLPQQAFVPNDTLMDRAERQILVVTGPNMAGKSTYLRQAALIVILAQMGSFVPAEAASVGIVDRIFTRIGAGESLARGRSTFLVEMSEVAYILHHATARSLVLLDEVGRGTSTYDGISIAWAVAEHLHRDRGPGPKTLFATHYHELLDLASELPGVVNLSMAVREWNDEIVFLRKVVEGGADRSYGIHAARVAGLPPAVLARARQILADLESGRSNLLRRSTPDAASEGQMDLFGPRVPEYLRVLEERLRSLDPDRLTPVEALLWIQELKRTVDAHDSEDPGPA